MKILDQQLKWDTGLMLAIVFGGLAVATVVLICQFRVSLEHSLAWGSMVVAMLGGLALHASSNRAAPTGPVKGWNRFLRATCIAFGLVFLASIFLVEGMSFYLGLGYFSWTVSAVVVLHSMRY